MSGTTLDPSLDPTHPRRLEATPYNHIPWTAKWPEAMQQIARTHEVIERRANRAALVKLPATDQGIADFYKKALDPLTTYAGVKGLALADIKVGTALDDKTDYPNLDTKGVRDPIKAEQETAAAAVNKAITDAQTADQKALNDLRDKWNDTVIPLCQNPLIAGDNPEGKLRAIRKLFIEQSDELQKIHRQQLATLDKLTDQNSAGLKTAYGLTDPTDTAKLDAIKKGLADDLKETQATQLKELQDAYNNAQKTQFDLSIEQEHQLLFERLRELNKNNPEFQKLLKEAGYGVGALSSIDERPFVVEASVFVTRNGTKITREENGIMKMQRDPLGVWADIFTRPTSRAEREKKELEDIRDHIMTFCMSKDCVPSELSELTITCHRKTFKDHLTNWPVGTDKSTADDKMAQQYWRQAVLLGVKPEVIKGYTPTEADKEFIAQELKKQLAATDPQHNDHSFNLIKALKENNTRLTTTSKNAEAAVNKLDRKNQKTIDSTKDQLTTAIQLMQEQFAKLAKLREPYTKPTTPEQQNDRSRLPYLGDPTPDQLGALVAYEQSVLDTTRELIRDCLKNDGHLDKLKETIQTRGNSTPEERAAVTKLQEDLKGIRDSADECQKQLATDVLKVPAASKFSI